MQFLETNAQMFFAWLLGTTCQVSVLIGLVLLVQWALRRRLSAQARNLLWLIVVLRMVMLWAPPSRLSVYNLLPAWAQPYHVHRNQAEQNLITVEMSQESLSVKTNAQLALAGTGRPETRSSAYARLKKKREISQRAGALLPVVWSAGALFLMAHILIHALRIRRIIRQASISPDIELLNLLHSCQREMGTQRAIRVIISDRVHSPGLFGVARIYLLLPARVLANSDRRTLRYIILHELAHLKRYDTLLGMISSAFHVVHWFNPVIGYGLKRMRADRELACDDYVLSRLAPHEIRAYGHTIVDQLEQLLRTRTPLVTGFLGGTARIKQRIAAISHYKRQANPWSPLALLLALSLAWTGLTDVHVPQAQARARDSAADQAAPLTETFAHTLELYIRNLETDLYLVTDGQRITCTADHPGNDGLWEARFNGTLGHGGGVLLYSTTHDGYLSYDDQGDLALCRTPPAKGSHWIVMGRLQGTWIMTEDIDHNYLRVDEQTPMVAEHMGRDPFSYWDMEFSEVGAVSHHVNWVINLDADRSTKYHAYKFYMSKYEAVLKAQEHNPAAQADVRRMGRANVDQLIEEYGG